MSDREQSDIAQLKLRLRETLRARVEESAQEKGVSMNTEIVERLDQSFAYGHADTQRLLQMMASMIGIIEQKAGKRWINDDATFARALAAIYSVLGRIGPLSHDELKALMRGNQRQIGMDGAKALLRYAGLTDKAIERALADMGGAAQGDVDRPTSRSSRGKGGTR